MHMFASKIFHRLRSYEVKAFRNVKILCKMAKISKILFLLYIVSDAIYGQMTNYEKVQGTSEVFLNEKSAFKSD